MKFKLKLLISCVALITLTLVSIGYCNLTDNNYNFGDVSISKSNFEAVNNLPYEAYVLCNTDNQKCVIVNKVGDINAHS